MTDASRPRDWRAQAKLAADMRRHGPVRPAVAIPVAQARLAGGAEVAVEASRVAAARAAREAAHAAAVKAEADREAAAKAAPAAPVASTWYATGESKPGGKTWDMKTGKPVARTVSRYVRLAAALTDAEAATAKGGGAGLQALIKRYGVAAQEWTTGTPA